MAEPVELLWANPACWSRVLRDAQFEACLKETRDHLPAPALPGIEMAQEQRAGLTAVLCRGERRREAAVREVMSAAIRPDGKYAPPLVVVEGALTLPFDEQHTLRVMVTTMAPFATDDGLRAALADAREYLAQPLASTEVTVTLTQRLRDAFARTRRSDVPGLVREQVRRALLLQRKYQQRVFLGEPHLRSLVTVPDDSQSLLTYIPATATNSLPLSTELRVRVLGEVHFGIDQLESHSYAIKVHALARLVPDVMTTSSPPLYRSWQP